MKEIKVLEGKVVAPEGMKVGIIASRFNEIIVNKLLGGAVDGLVRHGVEEENITAAWVPGAFEIPVAASAMAKSGKYDAIIVDCVPPATVDTGEVAQAMVDILKSTSIPIFSCSVRSPRESLRWDWQRRCRYSSAS